jgi:O-antigen/teichoic acid export membrane protein
MMVRHGLAYALARGLPAAVNFAAIAIYTRLLEPAEYGRYAVVVAAIGMAHMAAFLWLQLSLGRFLPAYRQTPERFLSSVLAGFLAVTLLVLAAALPAILWLDDARTRHLLLIGLVLLLIEAYGEIHLRLANARLQPTVYGRIGLVRAAVALAVGSALVALGDGAEGVLVGLAVGYAVASIRPSLRVFKGCGIGLVDPAILRRLLIYGAPLVVTIAFDYVLFVADRLLIARLIGIDAAGIYAVGHDLTNFTLGTVLVIVNLAAYPIAVRAYEEGGLAQAAPKLRQNALLLWGLGLPAAAGMAILAANITGVIAGPAFRESAVAVMPIIALAVLIQKSRTFYFDMAFQLTGRVGIQAVVSGAAAIVNLALNLILIPAMGLVGAAWATVAASALALTLSIALGRRHLALPLPWADLARLALATLVMAGAVWPLRDMGGLAALGLQVATGGLAFAATAWLLDVGGLRRTLWRQLRCLVVARFATGRPA